MRSVVVAEGKRGSRVRSTPAVRIGHRSCATRCCADPGALPRPCRAPRATADGPRPHGARLAAPPPRSRSRPLRCALRAVSRGSAGPTDYAHASRHVPIALRRPRARCGPHRTAWKTCAHSFPGRVGSSDVIRDTRAALVCFTRGIAGRRRVTYANAVGVP